MAVTVCRAVVSVACSGMPPWPAPARGAVEGGTAVLAAVQLLTSTARQLAGSSTATI